MAHKLYGSFHFSLFWVCKLLNFYELESYVFLHKVLYEVLDIPMNASIQNIRDAYLDKLRECDPSRVSHLDEDIQALARAKKAELDNAYEILADLARREEYDRWILNNSQLKVTDDGRILRKKSEEQIELSARELEEMLLNLLYEIKTQIFSINDQIRWTEGQHEGFDVYLEGKHFTDRYYTYIITVDLLQAIDIENLIANTAHLTPNKGLLLHKNYSLFLVICLDNQEDEQIRDEILRFNQRTLNKKGAASSDKVMLAFINLKERDFYFPYVTGFRPDYQALKLPKGYSLNK